MNVRSLYTPSAPARLDPVRRKGAHATEHAPAQQRPTHLRKVTDEVILSARARVALDELRSRPELDTHIRAKMHPDQLNAHRTYEVVSRIERGYYRDPHVLRRVAYGVSGALMDTG